MEQNTAEEIYSVVNKSVGHEEYKDFHDFYEWSTKEELINTIQNYTKQQQEIAIDKALEVASLKAYNEFINSGNARQLELSILSLKSEILKKLEK